MKTLGMKNLEKFLTKIVKHKLHNSLMIWGAPGIGKIFNCAIHCR